VDTIRKDQLAMLLSGKYQNWAALTGENLPVNIYGRQSNSGTYSYVRNKLQIQFSPYAKEMNGNAQILEAIKHDHSGIGYVGAGYLVHGGVKGLKVLKIVAGEEEEAISPLDSIKIAKGRYLFQRPLYQYFLKESLLQVRAFIYFEKSDEDRNIIKQSGYYTIQ
jgi:phosphate transport system substrate-binding protein